MNEDIQELFQTLFVWLWIIIILFVVGISTLTVIQYNNFQNAADQVISRYGGVTNQATTTLNKMADNFYGGRFRVSASAANQSPKSYGSVIDYTINVKLPVLSTITNIPVDNSTVANVRKESRD